MRYFYSKEFKNQFELRVKGTNNKTIIDKVSWLIDEVFIVYLYCTIHSHNKINSEEYKKNIENALYEMSYSGVPTVSKYGKYLGQYKGRYGMHLNNVGVIFN